MLKLSSGFKAGLRILVFLSQSDSTGPVPVSAMVPHLELSDKYLEQLLLTLRRAGLVNSVRGVNGGFVLTRTPGEISLRDVLVAVQGPIHFCECQKDNCHECVRPQLWMAIERCISQVVDGVTLRDLLTGHPIEVNLLALIDANQKSV